MPANSVSIRPEDDIRRAVAWWNNLHESERRNWLVMANSAVPADAWKLRCALIAGIHGRAAV